MLTADEHTKGACAESVLGKEPPRLKCVLVLGVSALLLLWGAWRCTFFDDEAFSTRRYCLPFVDMVSDLHRGVEPDPPLYYLIENAWIDLVGPVSPGWMRVPSIAFFLIGLLVLRLAGVAWFDRRTGDAALVLAALHPAHLLLGFAARWYALMFLCVAALLLATERATRANPGRPRRDLVAPWAMCAALACYTNYFGVVVAGLMWLVGAARLMRPGASDTRHANSISPVVWKKDILAWCAAGLVVIVIYAPWLPAFLRQLLAFPRVGGGFADYGATAARTLVALTSGNLASPVAWWVHAPMALAAIIAAGLAVRQWRTVWPIAAIVAGCLIAGIASHSMLDKYIMTYSGVACVLLARLLFGRGDATGTVQHRWVRRVAIACLAVGWAGCLTHLVTGRHWSSLRWLDPFEQAATMVTSSADGSGDAVVVSHPAAAYYVARHMAMKAHPAGSRVTDSFQTRMDFITLFGELLTPSDDPHNRVGACDVLLSPAGGVAAIQAGEVAGVALQRIVTVESAEFADDTHWQALRGRLAAEWALVEERLLLEDPDAALKDRLDPRFKHPRHRVTVRVWDVK